MGAAGQTSAAPTVYAQFTHVGLEARRAAYLTEAPRKTRPVVAMGSKPSIWSAR